MTPQFKSNIAPPGRSAKGVRHEMNGLLSRSTGRKVEQGPFPVRTGEKSGGVEFDINKEALEIFEGIISLDDCTVLPPLNNESEGIF